MIKSQLPDIVIDANVACLYGSRTSEDYKPLFIWLAEHGHLAVSEKLINEYIGSGNQFLAVLINELMRTGRLIRISSKHIKSFTDDRHYNYTCNFKDTHHAKLVYLSARKLLVSQDIRLVNDINGYRKVEGIKPIACVNPDPSFYE